MTNQTKQQTGAGHTRGPWRFREGRRARTFGEIMAADDDGAFTLAELPGRLDREYGVSGEAMANARLIAAAPSMLEALREIVYALRFVTHPDARVAMNAAEAAIRRAEGAQP